MSKNKIQKALAARPVKIDLKLEHQDIQNKFKKSRSRKILSLDKETLSSPDLSLDLQLNEISADSSSVTLSQRPEWEIKAAEFPAHEAPKVGR